MKFINISITLLSLSTTAPAVSASTSATLCSPQEKTSISFETKASGKIASICEGPGDSYLVYRFGKPGAIELSYPDQLTKDSWRQFSFSGYQRPGGPANDGMGDYSLEFTSKDVTYTIYQQWRDLKKSYALGILVETKGHHFNIAGSQPTQSGSLVLLEGKNSLPNQDDGQ